MSSLVGNPGRPPYVIPRGSAGLKKTGIVPRIGDRMIVRKGASKLSQPGCILRMFLPRCRYGIVMLFMRILFRDGYGKIKKKERTEKGGKINIDIRGKNFRLSIYVRIVYLSLPVQAVLVFSPTQFELELKWLDRSLLLRS